MTEDAIRATEARTYIGADAVAVGLADTVGDFESVLSDLTAAAPASRLSVPRRELIFTQADVDRARAEGRAAGVEASITDGGIVAALAHINAITSLPEAQGRQKFAFHLASMAEVGCPPVSVDAARAILTCVPTEADVVRAGGTSIGLVIDNVNNRKGSL
jgi:ClpP class serine protease